MARSRKAAAKKASTKKDEKPAEGLAVAKQAAAKTATKQHAPTKAATRKQPQKLDIKKDSARTNANQDDSRPMKKNKGTAAGIPRASGERNSPTNGSFPNNHVSTFYNYLHLSLFFSFLWCLVVFRFDLSNHCNAPPCSGLRGCKCPGGIPPLPSTRRKTPPHAHETRHLTSEKPKS